MASRLVWDQEIAGSNPVSPISGYSSKAECSVRDGEVGISKFPIPISVHDVAGGSADSDKVGVLGFDSQVYHLPR